MDLVKLDCSYLIGLSVRGNQSLDAHIAPQYLLLPNISPWVHFKKTETFSTRLDENTCEGRH